MLLDYAAHVKCRTQHHVLSTAVSLSHLTFSSTAQQLLLSLHAELVAITSRSQARQRVKRRLDRTQQQLDKVNRLIQQGNEVMESVRDDADAADNTTAAAADGDNTATGNAQDGSTASGLSQSPPNVDLDLLTEQIRQLKEQMEMFAKMQQTAAAGAANDSAASSSEGEDDVDSSTDIPIAPLLDVPIAPPLTTAQAYHKSTDSMSFASIPIASPMLQSEIPIAPPLLPAPAAASAASSVPIAPPLILLPSDCVNNVPAAPPIISITPPAGNASTAVPAAIAAAAPASGLPPLRPSRAILSPLPPSAVYTRNIPGSESLSHTDLIRVAARIKLRRTNVPRSPGGTPCKAAMRLMDGSGSSVIGLGDALRLKFRNIHSHSQRQQLHSHDKENENWEDE
jgi:hypothetical protein